MHETHHRLFVGHSMMMRCDPDYAGGPCRQADEALCARAHPENVLTSQVLLSVASEDAG